jgi:general secretion pathway protein E
MEPPASHDAVVTISPSPRFLDVVPHDVARRHLIFGHAECGGRLLVLHAAGVPAWAISNVALWCGMPVVAEQADSEFIAREIDVAYARFLADREPSGSHTGDSPLITLGAEGGDFEDLEADLARVAASADADLLNTDQKGPVVRLVDALLFEAIGQGASDIHVQPLATEVLVRFRVDGVLATARTVPLRLGPAIVTRIKVMARMDVAERRAPQDGRATVAIGGNRGRDAAKTIDLRISTLPTAFGERVVVRMLYAEQSSTRASIASLAMPPDVEAEFLDRSGRSSGIVLVTGPTGSGKTTTLYATLRWVIGRSATGRANRNADVNVMTIEDPIEYDLSAADVSAAMDASTPLGLSHSSFPISQTQVDVKKGLTFASGLRHILRQDPDVIMVGEIRDGETARIAIQASLTGHLVFSSLHTNDAPSAISRLIDLDVEPFLICSTLSAVLAQRLVRLLHIECGGRGCPGCLGTGYRGRRGLFELLLMDDAVRVLVARGASSTDIRRVALQRGMRSLADEGGRLASAGITTSAEVQRVTLGVD